MDGNSVDLCPVVPNRESRSGARCLTLKDPALVHLLETNVYYVPEPWCSWR